MKINFNNKKMDPISERWKSYSDSIWPTHSEVNLVTTSETITANNRKLKAVWTVETYPLNTTISYG